MARRKRKHIPIIEKLASALADKLPQEERDALRAAEVPASQVVRMFTPDHVKLHSWGGKDKWHNLTMTRRGPELKKKDGLDTSRAAKAVRIIEANKGFSLIGPKKRSPRHKDKPVRTIQGRGFQKPPPGYKHYFGRRPESKGDA